MYLPNEEHLGELMYDLKRKLNLTKEHEILVCGKVLALPRQERLVIYLYYWEQYSHLQIARDLCLPVSDVPRIIQNAFARLRGELLEVAGNYFETYGAANKLQYKGA